MSERFEIISMECLGPLSKTILVGNLLTNNLQIILSSLKLTPLESLILKASSHLYDGKTSFIVFCAISLRNNIKYDLILKAYHQFHDFEIYLDSYVKSI